MSVGLKVDLGCEVVPLVRATSAVNTTCTGMEKRHIHLDERGSRVYFCGRRVPLQRYNNRNEGGLCRIRFMKGVRVCYQGQW